MRRIHLGLSLTELMIAVALLATALAGGIGALAQAQSSHRESAAIQQLHERAQYVFGTLEPEIQMAGYFGPARPGRISDVPDPAAACGAELVSRLDIPLAVLPGWTLPCAPRNGGAAPGSDVLILRRASARLAVAPEAGRAQWLAMPLQPAQSQLYWHGEAPRLPSPAPQAGELRDIVVDVYYVAKQADGDATTTALRVKSLSSVSGVPAFIDREVMSGVEGLRIQLLPSADTPLAARIELRVTAQGRGPTTSRALAISRVFALRNGHG